MTRVRALIGAYARSPFQRAVSGRLGSLPADHLAAQVVHGLMQRCCVDPALIDDLMLGCSRHATPHGHNLGRRVALLSGLPVSVGGMTVQRLDGSSMQAIHLAAATIEAGMAQAVLCVGVESSARGVPLAAAWEGADRLAAMAPAAVGADTWHVGDDDQRAASGQSHAKAIAARAAGRLRAETVPIVLDGGQTVTDDGCPRRLLVPANLRANSRLFTAPAADGAAAVLVVSDVFASRHGVAPLARVRAFASTGVAPAQAGLGLVSATRKALDSAGVMVGDLDVVELHEAFAAQAIACLRALHFDPATVNIDGGSLALGDPAGATGARLAGKAAALLARGDARFALAAQSIGDGQGIATVLERV